MRSQVLNCLITMAESLASSLSDSDVLMMDITASSTSMVALVTLLAISAIFSACSSAFETLLLEYSSFSDAAERDWAISFAVADCSSTALAIVATISVF